MAELTDTLTYKNAEGNIVFELERTQDGTEFVLVTYMTDAIDDELPMTIILTEEDMEILQSVVRDALDNRV